MSTLIYRPLDSLFFRDGRPYNREESQTGVCSQFPPFAPTLIGAARAAFARALGWREGPWNESITALLGDGVDLGRLEFGGPYVLQGESTPVFPVPLSLLKTRESYIRLKPGARRECDLGSQVRLPEAAEHAEGAREAKGWITAAGLRKVLAGGVPDAADVIEPDALFRLEPRVGHWRAPATRTVATDEALYSPTHVRLRDGICLALNVGGLPADLRPASPTPLGGENRLAWIERCGWSVELPHGAEPNGPNGRLCYTVLLATPLDIADIGVPKPNQPYAGLPGNLVSACLGRIQRAGGWDGRDPCGRPLPLRTLLPAGSALFMQAAQQDFEAVQRLHGHKIGARPEWGFGQILIGTWED